MSRIHQKLIDKAEEIYNQGEERFICYCLDDAKDILKRSDKLHDHSYEIAYYEICIWIDKSLGTSPTVEAYMDKLGLEQDKAIANAIRRILFKEMRKHFTKNYKD